MSKRFKREIISVATGLVALITYFVFLGSAAAIYLAVCVGYTVLVFGLLWSDGKWAHWIAGRHTARELIQGHMWFLLLVVTWIWLCRYATPWLPDWMFNLGPHELTPYLIFSGLGIVATWWGEQSWLAKPAKKNEPVGTKVL